MLLANPFNIHRFPPPIVKLAVFYRLHLESDEIFLPEFQKAFGV